VRATMLWRAVTGAYGGGSLRWSELMAEAICSGQSRWWWWWCSCMWVGGPPMSVLDLSVFSALANNKMFKIACSSSDVVS
jgi:hypothetical protein